MLTNKNTEFEKLKLEIDTQSERLNTRYMQELNFEKEKSMQTQYTAQQKYDKEKKDLEVNFSKLQKSMETRLGELETANKVSRYMEIKLYSTKATSVSPDEPISLPAKSSI
jgi:hypothetical protein